MNRYALIYLLLARLRTGSHRHASGSFFNFRGTGKAVKAGHSCAAVTQYEPLPPDRPGGKANRCASIGEGEEARQRGMLAAGPASRAEVRSPNIFPREAHANEARRFRRAAIRSTSSQK